MLTTVTGAAPISRSVEACWRKLSDLTLAGHYVPGLLDCFITTEQKTGIGASRRVIHERVGEMDESVIAWDEGIGISLRLHRGSASPSPFREATFRYDLIPDSNTPDACRIQTSLTYRFRFGPLGNILNLLARPSIRQSVVDTAVCLAEYYETERPVPNSDLDRLRRNALAI